MCVLSRFSLVQLYNPLDSSPPGSSVHGILQAKILEWVVKPSSRGIFLTHLLCIPIGRQVLCDYHLGSSHSEPHANPPQKWRGALFHRGEKEVEVEVE